MNTRSNLSPSRRHARAALLAMAAMSMQPLAASADNFANAYYDAKTDELVVTMSYSGTNPNHEFSIVWGECQTPDDASTREIAADVNDSQALDAARKDFTTTTRFSLADLSCRPAKLTLRTAPRYTFALQIPARAAPR